MWSTGVLKNTRTSSLGVAQSLSGGWKVELSSSRRCSAVANVVGGGCGQDKTLGDIPGQ